MVNDPNLISVMQEAVEKLNSIYDQLFALAILIAGISMVFYFGKSHRK